MGSDAPKAYQFTSAIAGFDTDGATFMRFGPVMLPSGIVVYRPSDGSIISVRPETCRIWRTGYATQDWCRPTSRRLPPS